jgi:hypothetical protein
MGLNSSPITKEMQPFPIPFEPTNLVPCLTIRSRKETNTYDTINARHVEMWQTDAPALSYRSRVTDTGEWWMDRNPTSSRLYRENLQQYQPYVIPSEQIGQKTTPNKYDADLYPIVENINKLKAEVPSPQIKNKLDAAYKKLIDTNKKIIADEKNNQTESLKNLKIILDKIDKYKPQPLTPEVKDILVDSYEQLLEVNTQILSGDQKTPSSYAEQIQFILASIDKLRGQPQTPEVKQKIQKLADTYKQLTELNKKLMIDSLAQNPYFNKYDVAGDTRNIVRELRSAVNEDIEDRGVKQSYSLLQREMDSRWLPQGYAKEKGIDQLSAYDLMKPRMNNMEKNYK